MKELLTFVIFQFWPTCLQNGDSIGYYSTILKYWHALYEDLHDDEIPTIFESITSWIEIVKNGGKGELSLHLFINFLQTILSNEKYSQQINWETYRAFDATKPSNRKMQEDAEKIVNSMNFSKKFTPDVWQSQLLNAYQDGVSALICAPTSSGKTFLAIEIIRDILSRHKREGENGVVIYLSPLKALACMVHAEMKDKFDFYNKQGKLIESKGVGLLTKEQRIDPDASVIVTTPEFCEILLLSPINTQWCSRLQAVFFDEIHYIGQEGRGNSLEHIFSFIRCPFYAFSATVPDPSSKFSQWLQTFDKNIRFINSTQRSTDLAWYIGKQMEPLNPFSLIPENDVENWIFKVPELIPQFVHQTLENVAQIPGLPKCLLACWLLENEAPDSFCVFFNSLKM